MRPRLAYMPAFIGFLSRHFKLGVICLAVIQMVHSHIQAQDIHFSQYLSSPFNLNPSLTGNFQGDYRLVGNYRNQWNSISVPYSTFGLAGDMTKAFGLNDLSLGASFFYDQAGDSRMNTMILQIPASYSYPLTADSSQKIYFGAMPGVVRQEFDYGDLNFDNQYNYQLGQFDPSLPTGENQNETSQTYFNLSVGLRWSYKIQPRHKVEAGLAMFNMLTPQVNYKEGSIAKLERRYNVHANYQVEVWKKIDLLPGVLYANQGKSNELVLGTSARYLFNGYTAFHAGYWYRNSDAGFATVGLTYQTLYVGMSYDINTSRLKEASRGRGAFEISVIYVFRKFRMNKGKYLSCPNYL